MEECYLNVEECVQAWIDDLLEAYGLEDTYELTAAQLEAEIKDEEDVLKNERIWNIGNNVEVHEAYLAHLHLLLENAVE